MPAVKPSSWLLIALAALSVALAAQTVRAQDFDEEPSSDAFVADHGGHGGGSFQFKLAGPVKVTSTTCGADTCFTIKGTVTGAANGKSEPVSLTAQGTNTNCGPMGSSTCCHASGTETIRASQGKINFSFTGTSCSISPKKDTLNVGLTFTSGTGSFAQASKGGGTETVTDNPENHGKGGVKGSGTLTR